jgi:protoheme IX farnesyltransferase
VIHSLALLLVSLTPVAAGLGGRVYLAGAVLLGMGLTLFAFRFAVLRTVPAARALFLASVLYLPALLALLLLGR